MIKEQELKDAIAECQGQREPKANTCIKMAAYYILLNQLYPQDRPTYSFAEPPKEVTYDSGSEFSDMIQGIDTNKVLELMDEVMDTLRVIMPKLYRATMDKLRNL